MFKRAFLSIFVFCLASCTTHPSVIPIGIISLVAVEGAQDYAENRQPYVFTDHALFCHPGSRSVFAIPRGYVTDFASIPSSVSFIIDPSGPYTTGAIVHDYLFAVGKPGDRAGFIYANTVLSDYMVEFGVSWAARFAISKAVGTDKAFRAYGGPDEWNKRFADLITGLATPPPFQKPADPKFRKSYDCDNFSRNYRKLHSEYSSAYEVLVKEANAKVGN